MIEAVEALTSILAPFRALRSPITIVRSSDGRPLLTTVTDITAAVITATVLTRKSAYLRQVYLYRRPLFEQEF